MDLAEIFRVMRRRWYVLLPGLLLTAALTSGAYLKVAVTYQSQSTVLLLNSQKATVDFDGNPFLSTQLSLNGMADSLVRNLNSDASIAELRARGATSTTVAKIADNALGPLMWLTTTGTDKSSVLASDRLLTTYAAERLTQFQAEQSVPRNATIRMMTIVPPQNPVAKTKTRTQYLILAVLMGIMTTMVGVFYVEARLRTPAGRGTRGRRRAGRAGAAGDAVPDETPAADRTAGDGTDEGTAGPGVTAGVAARPAPQWSSPGSAEPDRDPDPEPDRVETGPTGTDAHRFV